jgi:NADPH:quinone reductase-like Zn-dependent oxidoreductase
MQAVTIVDGELVVAERPDPSAGAGEVVIEVAAAGVNAADLLQLAGFYPAPPGVPADIPGLELSGTVLETGTGVDASLVGQRVMAIVGGGAQASRVVVHASHLLAVPATMDLVAAGGFPEAFSTAHDALVTQGGLTPGARVLVTGAAGGVGTAAVQLAHALGASVVASARDASRAEALRALGADVVVQPDEVATSGPYDVVLELVGAQSLTGGVLTSLAPQARVVVIGVGGGSRVEVDLLGLMATRSILTGSTLRARNVEEKAAVAAAMRTDVVPLLDDGRLQVPVLATFPLAEARAAYERFAGGSKLGKIILTT